MAQHTNPVPARFWTAASGGSAVEFALIAPILTTLFLGMTDLSLWIHGRMQVAAAAKAGADYAAANGYDAAKIRTAITSATSRSGITATPAPTKSCGCADAARGVAAAACGTTCPSGDAAGTYVTASATATYATIVAWPGISSPVTLSSSAKVRLN